MHFFRLQRVPLCRLKKCILVGFLIKISEKVKKIEKIVKNLKKDVKNDKKMNKNEPMFDKNE